MGKSVTWTNRVKGRPTTNISRVEGCLIGDASSANNVELAWNLFMTPDMIIFQNRLPC